MGNCVYHDIHCDIQPWERAFTLNVEPKAIMNDYNDYYYY